MDHVRVTSSDRSPLDSLSRNAFLYDRPRLNLCNQMWLDAIKDEARRRGLAVMLTGDIGNLAMSYSGIDLLPSLLRRGRLVPLARESTALMRGGMRLQSLLSTTLAPFLPIAFQQYLAGARGRSVFQMSATAAAAASAPDYREKVAATYTRSRNSLAGRLSALRLWDSALHNKGTLGGWGIDIREPTADRRLVEFCLRVPLDQYLRAGVTRALARDAFADRLPEAVWAESRRGYQSSDWHESLCASRDQISREVEQLSRTAGVGQVIDMPALKRLVEDWPEDWTDAKVTSRYRYALLRAISAGHFIRHVSGAN